MPGKAKMEYWYNIKDLLGASRNKLLQNRNLWYAYNYDMRGRELSSGFYNTAPPTSGTFTNLIPSEKLSETIFGTSAFEKNKVKTQKTKVLGSSNTWLEQSFTYNVCNTVNTITANNHLDLTKNDITTFFYDGVHNVVKTNHSHSTPGHSLSTVAHSSFDHVGRSDSIHFDIDGTTIQGSASTYDHKNQLTAHRVGIPNAPVLQQYDYTYRENGMLTTINRGLGYQSNDLYTFELRYDQAYIGTSPTIRKNGDIINTAWQTKGATEKIYSYEYDYLDRITSAVYKETDFDDKYNTAYTYEDQRGNIRTITRDGYHLENGTLNAGQIDNLRLYYSGNELTHVNDSATGTKAKEGYYKNGTGTYGYDDHGNMDRDPIKEYSIKYNHLDLPDSIFYDDGRKYVFTYDAGGGLLQKRIFLNASTRIEKHDYINGIEYVNGDIESIYTPEGRAYNNAYMPDTLYVIDSIYGMRKIAANVILSNGSVKDHPSTTIFEMDGQNALVLMPGFKVETAATLIAQIQNNTSTGWRAQYFVTDQVGNTRLVYSDLNDDNAITADEIIQENHYYAHGLLTKWNLGNNDKDPVPYKYNGIELLDAFELNLNMAPLRMQDPSLGRWYSIDVDAEQFSGLSTYVSNMNSPIVYADPNGDNPLLIGAAIGLLSNGVGNVANGNGFFQGAIEAAAFGGLTGGYANGIGNVSSAIGMTGSNLSALGISNSLGTLATVVNIGGHAALGGIASMANGGGFGAGAISGGFGASAGLATAGLGSGGMLASSGLSGGVGSVIGGGNFWSGAGQGLIAGGLNHVAHQIQEKINLKTHKNLINRIIEAFNDPDVLKNIQAGKLDLFDIIEPNFYAQSGSFGANYKKVYLSLGEYKYMLFATGQNQYNDYKVGGRGFNGNLYNYFELPNYIDYPSLHKHGGFFVRGTSDRMPLITISSSNYNAVKYLYSVYKN